MYPPAQISDPAALARLQARLRQAERRAQRTANGGTLDACAFTFLLSLSPSIFARSPGISLAEVAACTAERENDLSSVMDAPCQEESGGYRAAEYLEVLGLF